VHHHSPTKNKQIWTEIYKIKPSRDLKAAEMKKNKEVKKGTNCSGKASFEQLHA